MTLLCDRGAEGVLRVRLNRPAKLNALNRDLIDELLTVQRSIGEDPDIRVVLLSGEGRSFCAGADLDYLESVYRDPARARSFLTALRDVIVNFERLPQPVIGAVQGHVLAGGLELAMGCDIVVAARSALIGDSHLRRNLIPGGGNTQRIPRRLGKALALDLLLTGRWLSAEEACAIGLVARVVDDDALLDEADALARQLAANSFTALREVKRLTHLAYATPLADGLELEIDAVLRYFDTPDLAAALAAFTEREP